MPKPKLPKPPVPLWRPVEADPTAFYAPEEVARSKAYQRPIQRAGLIGAVIGVAEIVLYVGLKIAPKVAHAFGDAWPLRLVVVLGFFFLLDSVIGLPISVWRFGHEKRWGFGTQTPGSFAADQVKQTILNLAITLPLFIALWAIIRATRLWWVFGSILLAVFGLVFALLGPALQKLFNKFTPLADDDLRAHLMALVAKAGARCSEIFVMDASKRTRKDNAFFAGLGKTKRIVIFDNMLEMGNGCVEVVVAHELGHWLRRKTVQSTVVSLVTGPVFLGAIAAFMRWGPALRFAGIPDLAGVPGERDPASATLFLLGAGILFFGYRYYSLWRSRWKERVADFDALELTRDLDSYRALWHKMPERNLPDLAPSRWQRIKASHPPAHERLAFADVWERAQDH